MRAGFLPALALLAGCTSLLHGCTSSADSESVPGEVAGEVSAGLSVPSNVVRGFLVLGHEVRSIKPCDEDRELWVVPIAELTTAYESLSREPYAPVFVEVEGDLGEAPETGFGVDFAGQLTVSKFRRAAPAEEGFGCREDVSAFAFRASGVEPFWGVQVQSGSIVYATPEIPQTVFAAAEPAVLAGGWVYETVSSGPESLTLSLRLTPERCSDPMVGAIYSWSAEVEIGGELRRGCAWEGALAPGR